MKVVHPRTLCALMALFALVAAAGAQTLRLAVSQGPVSTAIYVAQAEGYFGREGVSVSLRSCTSGKGCLQMLTQGETDLATAAELPVTLDSFTGADVAIIATLSASMHHIKLVARRGAGIRRAEDLRGKRIATVAGTSAHYFLDSWLLFNAIDPKEVSVRALAPEQLVAALSAGEADAIVIWEPLAAQAMDALGRDAVELPSPRIYTQHFCLVASRSAIGRHTPDLVKLLRALARAERFIAEQPSRAQRILAAQSPRGVRPDALAEHDFRLTLDQSLISTMDGQARWAVREGLAPPGGHGNLLHSIEASPLRQAAPGSVSLVQ